MIVKLGLDELVRGTGSSLESLQDDLIADFYVRSNRREGQYVVWAPMGYRLDGLAVSRWYGVRMARNQDCASCGTQRGCLPCASGTLDAEQPYRAEPTRGIKRR